jgi:hypothetical protein
MADLEHELEQRLKALPDGPKPRDVDCGFCGAKPGYHCKSTTSSFPARTHVARWEAVGISKPTYLDKDRDVVDGDLRDLRRKLASLPDMSWLRNRREP